MLRIEIVDELMYAVERVKKMPRNTSVRTSTYPLSLVFVVLKRCIKVLDQ